jgi:acetoin utilization protein AcuB
MTDTPLRVEDLMTPDPVCVTPDTTIADAAAKMKEIGCRHLPVCEGERIRGVLSSKDVLRAGTTVAEVMSRTPLTIAPYELVEVAAGTMASRKVGCLLVLEEERLVGILTTYDVLDAFAQRARVGRTSQV